MTKTCNFCGNARSHEKSVEYLYRHEERFLLVKNVPCEECDFCGEQYFAAKVLKKIERDFHAIVSLRKKVKHTVTIPVEEFAML
ncbi:MAG: YgiT-type zinc finger domain-containing protein [Planctomycetes bacterium RBG_16_59_8]|nr:MAG: YgiT-type zinc finger domain-containing protein [Planctomycetes bacterium RBG_16_59_8]